MFQFSSDLSLSCVLLFVTSWTAACQTSLSFTVSWSLLKFMSIESLMLSCRLISSFAALSSFCLQSFPSIRVFSNESALHIRWPQYWSFRFNISPSNECSGMISFRMEWLDLLEFQGTLKSLQHHNLKASILRCSAFFSPTLTSIHDHWKNQSLD